MKHVALGNTGLQVSELCLGTMMFGDHCNEVEADQMLSLAMDAGVNFVDTAAMYMQGETETILGRLLTGRREKLTLMTKVNRGLDANSIQSSLEDSLHRLQTDYVDVYMIHWPQAGMQLEEMMGALDQVVRQGKTRFVGCSNFPAWLFAQANAVAQAKGLTPLVYNQVPYNLIERGVEIEILPQAQALGIALGTYRPLCLGLLTGKYRSNTILPADSRVQRNQQARLMLDRYGLSLDRLADLAEVWGYIPVQLAIAWVRYAPAVTSPVIGASSLGQLEMALGGFEFDLTEDQYLEVTQLFDAALYEESAGQFAQRRRMFNMLQT